MIGATPADLMAMMAERHGLYTSEVTELEVGGRPALLMDLTVTVDPECMQTGGGRIWLWTLPVQGDFHFVDHEQARVIAVDGGSATVILVVEAGPDVDWDHLLEHFTELVETMTISPL